jgi:hypothetical protein
LKTNRLATLTLSRIKKHSRKFKSRGLGPGANPTIVSYNAGAVKIYYYYNSLVRFENKNIFFFFEKHSM